MNPSVSIVCDVYNHGAFLRNALDGFIMQKVNFPIEILIHDDASSDNSAAIIREYESRYPDIVRPIYETENQYHKQNLWADIQFPRAKGKYIALCEGDDYWTDPLKLQKQVDYMEAHSGCWMCCHAAYWERNGELAINGCQYQDACDLTTDEVIRYGGLYLATASLLFRKDVLNDTPAWMRMADIGDYPLQILCSLRGPVHFLPQPMCVYRYQRPGSWTYNDIQSGVNLDHLNNEVAWMNELDKETAHNYSTAIFFHLKPFYRCLREAKEISAFTYFRALRRASSNSLFTLITEIFLARLRTFLPKTKNRTL